jgi:hypothetical protein
MFEMSESNFIDEFYVINAEVPMQVFHVGDMVVRADDVDKRVLYQIISIVKSARLNYKNKVVIKHRVQVKSEKSWSSVISYSKNFPYNKVLPKAGEADKVD